MASVSDVPGTLIREAERIRNNEKPDFLDTTCWKEAIRVCSDTGLALDDLAMQVEASAIFYDRITFDTYQDLRRMMQNWVHPHARMLLGLSGLTYRWQHEEWFPFAESLFLTGVLINLEQDVKRQHFFIPADMLANAGVTYDDLGRGRFTEEVGHLLWKWSIRTRDGYGQARELIPDVPLFRNGEWRRWHTRKVWVTGLTLIRKAEKKGFDVWNTSFDLTGIDRVMIFLQILFGRNRRRL